LRLIESWGLRPDIVVGHAGGELAAAHAAGVLTLPDACAMAVARARLVHALASGDSMASTRATEELRAIAAGTSFSVPTVPMLSTVTGTVVTTEHLRAADYWVERVRSPARLADTMNYLRSRAASVCLEVGADGMLTALGPDDLTGSAAGIGPAPALVTALRADLPETSAVLAAAAHAYVRGAGVDWPVAMAGLSPQRVPLPTYPFQRRRYWLETPEMARV
jgi:acyl transferase domain-containing protein